MSFRKVEIKDHSLAEAISLMMDIAAGQGLQALDQNLAWSETNTNIERRVVVKYILTKINTNLLLPRPLQNIEHTSRANCAVQS